VQKAEQDSLFKFSPQYRLKTKQDFQSVFANPQKIAHQQLLLLYRANQRPHARIGIIIGKQHVAFAVNRNRLRRMVRESFRHHKESLKGLDLVVLVRSKWRPSSPITGCERASQDKGKIVGRDDIDKLWLRLTDTFKFA